MKINGVNVEECENFTMYSLYHCNGIAMCSVSPDCEFKKRKRKQEEESKNEK